jgi:hypothetical protein
VGKGWTGKGWTGGMFTPLAKVSSTSLGFPYDIAVRPDFFIAASSRVPFGNSGRSQRQQATESVALEHFLPDR